MLHCNIKHAFIFVTKLRLSFAQGNYESTALVYGEKKPIKKNQIKEFGGRMPRRRPRDTPGTSQGHLEDLGLIYV